MDLNYLHRRHGEVDLNYLYYRHQVSLFNADNAACEDSRRAHLSLVASYAARIEKAKSKRPQPVFVA